jgi:hypothetical protein
VGNFEMNGKKIGYDEEKNFSPPKSPPKNRRPPFSKIQKNAPPKNRSPPFSKIQKI